MKPNIERNKDLVLKRINDPKKWSFEALGAYFRMHKTTAEQIFKRDVSKFATKKEITAYLQAIKKS